MPQLEDGIDLGTHGYRREMPQRFSVFSLIALSFSLTGSWATLGSSMGIAIKEGSAAGTVWSPLIGAAMTAVLSLGMAELASAYPVASGQYYWAFRVSSKEYRLLASYVLEALLLLSFAGLALIIAQERLGQYNSVLVIWCIPLQLHLVIDLINCFPLVSGISEQELASMACLCRRDMAWGRVEFVWGSDTPHIYPVTL